MILEANHSYIQKNPLFGRKLIRMDRMRPSVWDWELCDVTILTIDREPSLVQMRSVASSVYDHQGLEEIPNRIFRKVESLVKLFRVSASVADEQRASVLRQETLGKIVELLCHEDIITDETYSPSRMQAYAEEYDRYSRQQMEHVTDVIDVHK